MENKSQLSRRQSPAGTSPVAIVIIAALLICLGVLGGSHINQIKDTALKRSQALTVLAQEALEKSEFDSAARYALSALEGHDTPVIGFNADVAEVVLAGAVAQSPHLDSAIHLNASIDEIATSPDGNYIATLNSEGLKLWDAHSQKPLASLSTDSYYMNLLFSPDSSSVTAGGNSEIKQSWSIRKTAHGTVTLISAPSPTLPPAARLILKLETANEKANYENVEIVLVTSPDGKTLLSSKGHDLHVWNTATEQMKTAKIEPYVELESDFSEALYSPDGRLIALNTGDAVVVVDSRTFGYVSVLRASDGQTLHPLAFSFDNSMLAVTTNVTTVQVFDVTQDMAPLTPLLTQIGLVMDAAFSVDGRALLVAGGDWQVRFWDMNKFKPLRTVELPRHVCRGHVCPPGHVMALDGKSVMIIDNSDPKADQYSVWDLASGRMVGTPLRDRPDQSIIGYADDNAAFVTFDGKQSLSIIDSRTHAVVRDKIPSPGPYFPMRMSSDHRYLAATDYDSDVIIYDLKSPEKGWRHLKLGSNWVAFTPNARFLRIYDPEDGDKATFLDLGTFKTDKRSEPALDQANAPRLFAGTVVIDALKASMQFVDVKTNQPIGQADLPGGSFNNERIAADDQHLYVITYDHSLMSYAIDPAIGMRGKRLIERACKETLNGPLSQFTQRELERAPWLDPKVDKDVCQRLRH